MPNWCYNTLTVTGESDDLQKFIKKAKGKGEDVDSSPLSFASLYPEPDYSKIKVEPTFPNVKKTVTKGTEWWDWRIQNWGTKWDACEAQIQDEWDEQISYSFETAWSPPLELLEKVSKDFPSLRFKISYEEDGVGFAGNAIFNAGEAKVAHLDY